MTQNFFDFNSVKNDEIVISHENEDVLYLLENLTCQLSYITGSSKSGKSTLVNKYAKIHKAQIISDQSDLLFSIDKSKIFGKKEIDVLFIAALEITSSPLVINI